jgi:hypothetical protein
MRQTATLCSLILCILLGLDFLSRSLAATITVAFQLNMRRVTLSCALIASAIFVLSCGSPGSQDQGLPPNAQVRVSAVSQLVTMDVKRALLTAVLAELGHQAQITVSIPDDLKQEHLSLAFQNLPLEDALKRVLTGRAYVALYKRNGAQDVIVGVRLFAKHEQTPTTDSASSSLQAIAPLQASQGLPTRPPTTGSWARVGWAMNEATIPANSEDLPFDELKRSFSEAQDPALRSAMLEVMENRGEEGPMVPILTNALSDPDEGVRETALNLLKSSYDPVPIGPLASMATLDKNPDFRTEAMTLMTDQLFMEDRAKEDWATVTAALNRGLSDPDAILREQAAMLLPELSQSAQPSSTRGF